MPSYFSLFSIILVIAISYGIPDSLDITLSQDLNQWMTFGEKNCSLKCNLCLSLPTVYLLLLLI